MNHQMTAQQIFDLYNVLPGRKVTAVDQDVHKKQTMLLTSCTAQQWLQTMLPVMIFWPSDETWIGRS